MAQIFKHFKGGIYELLHIALDSENLENRLVVYRSLETNRIFVRPFDNFFSEVKNNSGDIVPRFKPIANLNNTNILTIGNLNINYDNICYISSLGIFDFNQVHQKYFSICLINGSTISISQEYKEPTTEELAIDLLYKYMLKKDIESVHDLNLSKVSIKLNR